MPTLTGTDQNDNIIGSDIDDVISGLAGNDQLTGNGGNDTIIAAGRDKDARTCTRVLRPYPYRADPIRCTAR